MMMKSMKMILLSSKMMKKSN